MKTEFNYFWGLLGFLGFLGYVLENPIYYAFFAFFILALVPVLSKNDNDENTKTEKTGTNEEKNTRKWLEKHNLQNIMVWIGSALLMTSGLILMATKTMSDILAFLLLLGIMALMTNFFTYVGMDKKAQDERLRKIGTYATTYSWYITLTFVSFLVITMYWGQNIHNPLELMGVVIFVMTFTMLIINTILSRKGDID